MVSILPGLKMKQTGGYYHPTTRVAGMILVVFLVWGEVRQAQAGCQRFGHSCFGAHGKRAELPSGGGDISSPNGENNPADYYAPAGFNNNNQRVMSPYLMDWLMSAHRGQPLPPINYPRQIQDELLSMGDGSRRK